MKLTATITLVLSMFVYLNNCSSSEIKNQISYTPNDSIGCSSITEVKSRLKCIGELIKQVEDIKNSKIATSKEKLERIDSRYVKYKTTYCLTNKKESEKYLCFDSFEEVYEPTTTATITNLLTRVGLGFMFGIITGVYVGN